MTGTSPPITPSTKVSMPIIAWIALLLSIGTGVGNFFVMRDRISANTARIVEIERERKADHELLTRIDERLVGISAQLKAITAAHVAAK